MTLDRWAKIRSEFRNVAFQVYGLSPVPLLYIALSTGISTLKTRTCDNSNSDASVRGNEYSH